MAIMMTAGKSAVLPHRTFGATQNTGFLSFPKCNFEKPVYSDLIELQSFFYCWIRETSMLCGLPVITAINILTVTGAYISLKR